METYYFYLKVSDKELSKEFLNHLEHLQYETYKKHSVQILSQIPARNYIFKVNNRNARQRSEICSKLTIKTPERRQ